MPRPPRRKRVYAEDGTFQVAAKAANGHAEPYVQTQGTVGLRDARVPAALGSGGGRGSSSEYLEILDGVKERGPRSP